jgi:hypothetical protein
LGLCIVNVLIFYEDLTTSASILNGILYASPVWLDLSIIVSNIQFTDIRITLDHPKYFLSRALMYIDKVSVLIVHCLKYSSSQR